jgi:hypothetical protein
MQRILVQNVPVIFTPSKQMRSVSPVVFVLATAVVCGFWDIGLRAAVSYGGVFPIMKPYFRSYGVLHAAALAAFVAALAMAIVLLASYLAHGNFGLEPKLSLPFVAWVALVSALVGLAMKYSNYAPPLASTYYSQPTWLTFVLDGISGILVSVPVLLVVRPHSSRREGKSASFRRCPKLMR